MTATVTAGAAGKVTFYDDVTILGTATLSGTQASLTTLTLPPGNRSLRAYYLGGDAHSASSSASIPHIVNPVGSLGLRTPAAHPKPSQILSLAAGDLNADGRQDLVMGSNLNFSIHVFLGLGDGSFATGTQFPAAGAWPSCIVISDFDGDGKMDLAVGGGSLLNIFLGNGDGTFQPARTRQLRATLTAIAAGDFNGDGRADLALASYVYDKSQILLGIGDGAFQDSVFEVGLGSGGVAVADFNRDGRADLVFSYTYYGKVGISLGNGDGTFQAPIKRELGSANSTVLAADFDSDGKPDIATIYPMSLTRSENSGVAVALGNGDGTLGKETFLYGRLFDGLIAAGDFNGDGHPDLAVTGLGFSNVSVAIVLGAGDGTFSGSWRYFPWFNFPAAADFNGDGRLDLVLAGGDYPEFVVMLGSANRDLSIQVSHSDGITQGAAAYTIGVTNMGDLPSSAQVRVMANLASGFRPTAIAGTGWSCALASLTCTRDDVLAVGTTYPTISITGSVDNSPASLTSTFQLTGGGDSNATNNTATDTTLWGGNTAPAISAGGVIGGGASTPPVAKLSPGGFGSIFGANFAPAGTFLSAPGPAWPTQLGPVCVQVGGQPAYITFVSPSQINFQAPDFPVGPDVTVQVTANCGTTEAAQTAPYSIASAAATPEFLYWVRSPNGQNPVVAVDAFTGAFLGSPGLIAGVTFTPAKPEQVVTFYGVSFGLTDPAVTPGTPPSSVAGTIHPKSVKVGALDLPASTILYAGVSPGTPGLYQVNIQLPRDIQDGDHALVLKLGSYETPAGFLTVRR